MLDITVQPHALTRERQVIVCLQDFLDSMQVRCDAVKKREMARNFSSHRLLVPAKLEGKLTCGFIFCHI